MMHEISIPYTVISSAARNLFRFPFPSSFAKPFRGSTVPTFSRYGVSRSSLSGTLPFTANEKDPSAPLGMTIREERVSQRTLYTIQRISIPPHCHFERSEKSFSSPFSTTPSLSRLWEAPPTAFPAIRCFPFLAVGHAPFYRQRKGSFASDDDTWDIPLPRKKSPGRSRSFFVSERLICQTARAWCLLLLQYQ